MMSEELRFRPDRRLGAMRATIQVRVSDEERRTLAALADRRRETLSDFVRTALVESIEKHAPK